MTLSLSRLAGSRTHLLHLLLFLDNASLDLSEDTLGSSEQLGCCAFVVAKPAHAPFGNLDSFFGVEQAIFKTVCEDLS